MSKKQCIFVGIFCILLLATNLTLWNINWKYKKSDDYIKELSSLNGKNDSLSMKNDSLLLQIDSLKSLDKEVEKEIITIEQAYEKEFIDIINQPVAADVEFFTNYLREVSQDSSGLPTSDNTTATETN